VNKQLRTFQLDPRAVDELGRVAQLSGLAPSRVVEALLLELAKFGPERIDWQRLTTNPRG